MSPLATSTHYNSSQFTKHFTVYKASQFVNHSAVWEYKHFAPLGSCRTFEKLISSLSSHDHAQERRPQSSECPWHSQLFSEQNTHSFLIPHVCAFLQSGHLPWSLDATPWATIFGPRTDTQAGCKVSREQGGALYWLGLEQSEPIAGKAWV